MGLVLEGPGLAAPCRARHEIVVPVNLTLSSFEVSGTLTIDLDSTALGSWRMDTDSIARTLSVLDCFLQPILRGGL